MVKLNIKHSAKVTGLLLIAATILVGAGALSANHYKDYKNNKAAEQQALAKQEAQEQLEVDLQKDALVKGYQLLFQECQKGLNAYNALPAATKTKVLIPSCGSGQI